MATIRVTITKAGRVNEYGQSLNVGTIYTLDYALGVSLIQSQYATDTDNSLGQPSNRPFDNIAIGGTVINGVLYSPKLRLPNINIPMIVIGGTGATYTQSGATVTVTWASHGMTAALNDASVYLTQSTGALLTGWFTNYTYVDANTFTCISGAPQTTSGNLGTNTAKTVVSTMAVPGGVLGPNGVIDAYLTYVLKNSVGTKTLFVDFAGSNIWTQTNTSNDLFSALCSVVNSNSTGVQRPVTTPFGGGTAGTNVVPARLTIDTTIGQNLTYAIQLASAADWCGVVGSQASYGYGA